MKVFTKMKIFTTKERKKLEAQLEEVQEGCLARLHSVSDVETFLTRLEKEELSILPVDMRAGVKVMFCDWERGTASHPKQGTVVELERWASGWKVLKVRRGYGVSMKPRAVRTGITEFDRVLSYNGFIVE